MKNYFSRITLFYYWKNKKWEFCGNGIILDNDTIISVAHIHEKGEKLAISRYNEKEVIEIFEDIDFVTFFERGRNQILIDLMILKNKWFKVDRKIRLSKNIIIQNNISIIGYNTDNNKPLKEISINTKIAGKQSNYTWGCRFQKDMQKGISGSPVFNEKEELLGVFISSIEKCELGIFLVSDLIIQKLSK